VRRSIVLIALVASTILAPRVFAGLWNYVESPTDFTIEIQAESIFDAETVLCYPEPVGWCDGLIDSQLWIYDSEGVLLASSDDSIGPYGITYASHIWITLNPGTYRLRAGRCCNDPDATWEIGRGYHLSTSVDAIVPVDPSPSPVEPSQSPLEPSPSVEPSPSPSPSESPSVEPSPDPSPTPSPELTPTPSPSPTPRPTPTPRPSPSESPVEPSATPIPTPEPSVSPSPVPEPSTGISEEVAAVVGEAVDNAVAAVEELASAVADTVSATVENVGKAAEAVANLGKDLTPEKKKEMTVPIIGGVIIAQVGGAAAASSGRGSGQGTRKAPK